MRVEPVPDDLSWLGLPPAFEDGPGRASTRPGSISSSTSRRAWPATPLVEAHQAARAFLDKCDFTTTEVGLISFSDEVTLQAEATDNVRRVQAALAGSNPTARPTSASALELARERLNRLDRTRYIVDPDRRLPRRRRERRGGGREGPRRGDRDRRHRHGRRRPRYLRRLASTEEGSIFARQGELVGAFGHIARIIAEGGRGLRKLS